MATQNQHPVRSTVRTVFQAVVGLAAVWGVAVQALGLDSTLAWVGGSLVVAAAITRVMAVPQVEAWLQTYFPWLAAAPAEPVGEVLDPSAFDTIEAEQYDEDELDA